MRTTKPRYELTIEPEADDSDVDGIRRLKAVLKRLLRNYRIKCISIKPEVKE